jgi:hypothetical protein
MIIVFLGKAIMVVKCGEFVTVKCRMCCLSNLAIKFGNETTYGGWLPVVIELQKQGELRWQLSGHLVLLREDRLVAFFPS